VAVSWACESQGCCCLNPALPPANNPHTVTTLSHADIPTRQPIDRGLDKFFKTLAKVASRHVFLLDKTENNWPKL
jgi:hypothetical protein